MARPRKFEFQLTPEEKEILVEIIESNDESNRRLQRAKILLLLSEGLSNKAVATQMGISPSKVGDVLRKFHSTGLEGALKDSQRAGRPSSIGAEAKIWVSSLASTLPKNLPDEPAIEVWTLNSLTQYVRQHCESQGFSCLMNVSQSQIRSLLRKSEANPQGIKYLLEREEQKFALPKKDVFLVYKRVDWIVKLNSEDSAYCFYSDTTTDINNEPVQNNGTAESQTISPIESEKPFDESSVPVQDEHKSERIGKLSLMAGINLMDGVVIGVIKESPDPEKFIEFLREVDLHYDPQTAIHMILDNQPSHRSKIVFDYLATRPGRFKFTFDPKKTAWLNLIEGFFSKLIRSKLRGQKFRNKLDLDEYMEDLLQTINQVPVVSFWDGSFDDIKQAFGA